MSEDPTAQVPSSAPNGQKPPRLGKVLTNRAIVISAVAVVMITGAAGWLLLGLYGAGTPADHVRLEGIRTVGTIVLGAGGAIALLLAARRQQTAEQDLVEKRRDLDHKERVQGHAEKVAAENHAHQQRVAEASERDATERRITELYTKAAEQLGSDKAPVRLAGLYALERLAQDNPTQRLTITDVICAYLRMPYMPPGEPPGSDGIKEAVDEHRELVQEREVRLTAQRILADHSRVGRSVDPPETYWGPLDVDLTGATLIEFNLSYCHVGVGKFMRARFIESAFFREANFSGWANFSEAQFDFTVFQRAKFAGEGVFFNTSFTKEAFFNETKFLRAAFDGAEFACDAYFDEARFVRAEFDRVRFGGGASFSKAQFVDDTDSVGTPIPAYVEFVGATFAQEVPQEVAPWVNGPTADVDETE